MMGAVGCQRQHTVGNDISDITVIADESDLTAAPLEPHDVAGLRIDAVFVHKNEGTISSYGTVALPVIVSFVSQKGGVGKSALARALAVTLQRGGLKVLVADLDPQQGTVVEWAKLRRTQGLKPAVEARRFKTADDAIIGGDTVDVLIIDGPARASAGNLELARQSNLIVQPSGCGLDDLRPAVLLFHELLAAGVGRDRLAVALCRTAGEPEEGAARRYLKKAKYDVLETSLLQHVGYREAMNHGAALIESADSRLNVRGEAMMDELLKKVRAAVSVRANRTRKEQAKR
jgi:chromosome partitioning protein